MRPARQGAHRGYFQPAPELHTSAPFDYGPSKPALIPPFPLAVLPQAMGTVSTALCAPLTTWSRPFSAMMCMTASHSSSPSTAA